MTTTKASVGRLHGSAVVYGVTAEIGRAFKELWLPGCFTKCLAEGGARGDVLALFGHNSDLVLGRRSAGTLELADKSGSLDFSIDLPDTQLGRDTKTSVARGDVNGMSFQFQVVSGGDTWSREPDGWDLRVVHEAEIAEISPVAFPAFRATSVFARAATPTLAMHYARRQAWQAQSVYGHRADDRAVRARHMEEYRPGRRSVPALMTVSR